MCELMQKLARQETYDNTVRIAENALNEGASIAFTAKITNLPIHEVEAIAERLGKKTAQYFSPIAKLTAFQQLDCGCSFLHYYGRNYCRKQHSWQQVADVDLGDFEHVAAYGHDHNATAGGNLGQHGYRTLVVTLKLLSPPTPIFYRQHAMRN